jgi:oxygen-dependent protoporphyrinogen oxidase
VVEVYDVIVVGAGIAGLTAAERVGSNTDLRVLVLEAQDRIGGRVRSRRAGDGWLNFGAHVLPGPESEFGRFITSFGVQISPIPGSVMGVAYQGRLVYGGQPPLYPLKLNISMGSRWGLIRWGAKTWIDLRRAQHLVPGTSANPFLARGAIFDADVDYAGCMAKLPRDAYRVIEAAVRRSGGEPSQLTAGAARDQFSLTFSGRHSRLANGIVGGTSTIIDALERNCQAEIRRRCRVTGIRRQGVGEPTVVLCAGGDRLLARQVILATKADDIAGIQTDLPEQVRAGLNAVPYGPYTVASFITRTTKSLAPNLYAMVVGDPGGPNMVFNLSNLLGESPEGEHVQSFMAYAAAARARELDNLDDEATIRLFADVIDRYLPGFSGAVAYGELVRWSSGLPIVDASSAGFLRGLSTVHGELILAGDYLSGSGGLEAAFASGRAAAAHALDFLTDGGPNE